MKLRHYLTWIAAALVPTAIILFVAGVWWAGMLSVSVALLFLSSATMMVPNEPDREWKEGCHVYRASFREKCVNQPDKRGGI
jgi:hypothetical protein